MNAEQIKALRENAIDLDEIILERLMELDNYRDDRNYFERDEGALKLTQNC